MSLVPDYDDSLSSSDSDSDDSSPEENERQPEKPTVKLPKPDFLGSNDPKTSVFKNPFVEAENAKEAILQKHVKMVDAKDNVVKINGKRICWNYRKGKCRFGHNCKYAHDSDLQKNHEQDIVYQRGEVSETSLNNIETMQNQTQNQLKRKKRPGLTQGLVPGKKVMKRYKNQKL